MKDQKELEVCIKELSIVKGSGSSEDSAELCLAYTSLPLNRMIGAEQFSGAVRAAHRSSKEDCGSLMVPPSDKDIPKVLPEGLGAIIRF